MASTSKELFNNVMVYSAKKVKEIEKRIIQDFGHIHTLDPLAVSQLEIDRRCLSTYLKYYTAALEQWKTLVLRSKREGSLIPNVYTDICEERIHQDEQWRGPEHDDKLDCANLHNLISYQNDCLLDAATDAALRERYIKIAALAVAAIESLERKNLDDGGRK